MQRLTIALILFTNTVAHAQYAPAAGQAGTTAMFKDSSAFVNWVKTCTIVRGLQDISDASLGSSFAGDDIAATGKADETSVVSLGDGGSATCTFQYPIMNGAGYDFAVFENSFVDNFLELAFVEVSSDGVYFARIPATSLTPVDVQIGSFDYLDPTKLNNLAGKYRGGFGTPFDLQELASDSNLNINNITHIRVVDVVGSIQHQYASRDSANRIINDPWPTPFPTGGFDLDAIGVIHQDNSSGIVAVNKNNDASIYPNPAHDFIKIATTNTTTNTFTISNYVGNEVLKGKINQHESIDISGLAAGVYFVKIISGKVIETIKFSKL
jgi:Secretion system C-terminal sorting domain